mmetsp:Transcript_6022/g.12932  ORF Transcript_6022/g.12932 Transcript_6022/m.12932 type:complete len:234 (-) Transcript_6022:729-1430(-)
MRSSTVKLWKTNTGEIIRDFPHRGPVRGVAWADGSAMFASISDPFVEYEARISIYDVPEDEDPDSYSDEPRLEIPFPKEMGVKATNVVFLNCNEALLVTFDDGSIRLYDPTDGTELEEIQAHEKKINAISFNRQKTMFITSSMDTTAKLYDVVDLEHIKTYKTSNPVNAAVISPTKDHILLGGGQDAMSVTTTSGKQGKFETRFFELVYENEFGSVKVSPVAIYYGRIAAVVC